MIDKFPRGVELVASAIIENDKGQILLAQAPNWNNKWTMPGGHIDPGETISQAVIREVKEEVGLNVKFIDVIVWGELINSKDFHRQAHFIYFDGYCKVTDEEVDLDNVEIKEYKWLSPEEALKLDLADSFPDTIQKFIEYKKNKND
jgi:nucleoside triphosphatase